MGYSLIFQGIGLLAYVRTVTGRPFSFRSMAYPIFYGMGLRSRAFSALWRSIVRKLLFSLPEQFWHQKNVHRVCLKFRSHPTTNKEENVMLNYYYDYQAVVCVYAYLWNNSHIEGKTWFNQKKSYPVNFYNKSWGRSLITVKYNNGMIHMSIFKIGTRSWRQQL